MAYHQSKTKLTQLGTMMLTALPLITAISAASLSGCGFHLRGYNAPMQFDVAKTAVIVEDDRVSFPLKLPLTQRLEAVGVDVVDGMTLIESADTPSDVASITVDNVRFKRYELVGVLTEIRLVLSADVTYQTVQNGRPVTLTNTAQVERSYQYNEASVSTDDLQGAQIRDWLYNSLARRITDQYVAIGLPKVSAAQEADTPDNEPANSATTVITPTP